MDSDFGMAVPRSCPQVGVQALACFAILGTGNSQPRTRGTISATKAGTSTLPMSMSASRGMGIFCGRTWIENEQCSIARSQVCSCLRRLFVSLLSTILACCRLGPPRPAHGAVKLRKLHRARPAHLYWGQSGYARQAGSLHTTVANPLRLGYSVSCFKTAGSRDGPI